MLIERLDQITQMRPFPLMGCVRRNVWTEGAEAQTWKWRRGTALLAVAAHKSAFVWPGGVFDCFSTFTQDGLVLFIFRGGKPKPWWRDDAMVLAGAIATNSAFVLAGVCVVFEVDGALHERYFEAPAEEAAARYMEALEGWKGEHPTRINKQSPRGTVICKSCPVKNRCDALDMELGETGDWRK
jgi:hypothetical protein